MAARRQRPGAGRNRLRIIGGQWRSRRLCFPDLKGLRPTGDRMRETLFNWLQPYLPRAHCLDLFAGSGALGLEALSRDAAEVVFVDSHPKAVAQLQENLEQLRADEGKVVKADALTYLAGEAQPFDIVFLDPPFRQGLLQQVCDRLSEGGWLSSGAHLYIENEKELDEVVYPQGWSMVREKVSGQVCSRLFEVE